MKVIAVISAAVLSLLLGTAPGYAQQEQHDQQEEQKGKPAQEDKKAQPTKPAKQEEKSAQQQGKNTKPEEKSAQQQEKNTKPEEKNAQQDKSAQREEKTAQQQQQHTQQAKPEQPAQRAGGNTGGRIPEDRYRANFGREHTFRVTEADYSRDRRFQYGGYWFGFVDPWPANWLYTQDVYVVDIDGVYYLCNAMYPGINIALNIMD